jgi:putative flippase GtrA
MTVMHHIDTFSFLLCLPLETLIITEDMELQCNVSKIISIIIIIYYSFFTGFSWYFSSWTNGEPHHSGFNFLIVGLSLCVMFLVQLFFFYFFSDSFCITFLSNCVATSISKQIILLLLLFRLLYLTK